MNGPDIIPDIIMDFQFDEVTNPGEIYGIRKDSHQISSGYNGKIKNAVLSPFPVGPNSIPFGEWKKKRGY